MKGGKRPLGYTIIEVMIVLAVSGIMFLIAATFISGKQERTSFITGSNDLGSSLQDLIEQVGDGQYSDIPLNCTFVSGVAGSTTVTPGTAGTITQGTQTSCVFLGKVMHFITPNPGHTYEVFSLAGGRVDDSSGTDVVTSLANSHPVAVGPLTTAAQDTPDQLSIKDVQVVPSGGGAPQQSFALGFIQSQGALTGSNSLASQGQTVGLYYLPMLNAGNNIGFNASVPGAFASLALAQSADICVTDGSYYAEIQLGDNNDNSAAPLSVNVKMDEATPCS